ncbi:MAG: xylulokinase [Candidatus Sumerlaeia bacterium]|nr:xylulokinase [Candidatus Sumerlaeia bacterium]
MRHYAGIDSGTQSTKVLIVEESGRVVGRGQATYGLIEGLGVGHKEQHPSTWLSALREAFAMALREAGLDGASVVALGVSGQQHGFVPLDASDEVIRPAKLWCDTATAPEAQAILEACGGAEHFAGMTGNALPAGFTASKILWLKRHEPQHFARLATVLLPHDWLNFWLTGEKAMEWGDASGTGLLDVRSRSWCDEAVRAIDERLSACLPALRPSSEPCGVLRREAAEALGLRPGVLVASGGGDNMMGAIGTGNVQPGVVTMSLGTSGTIYACSGRPVIDPQGEIAAFCDSTGQWLPLLCTMNVTVASEMAKGLFGLDTKELNARAASVPAGAQGLLLLPYFEGERVPNVPDGTGVWFGHRARTNTPGHFARAAMEGATMGLNYGFRRMRDLGIAPDEIRLTGGGSKSAVWRAIAASVFGTPVVCCTEPEGAALGAALQARWILERRTDPSVSLAALAAEWVRLDATTRAEPDPAHVALYGDLQELHDGLSRALRPLFASHRDKAARKA